MTCLRYFQVTVKPFRIKMMQTPSKRMKSYYMKVYKSEGKQISWMEQHFHASSYYFENGIRKVYPFYRTHKSNPRGRWVGKSVKEILTSEFKLSDLHLDLALRAGRFKVNNKPVSSHYIVKPNDILTNTSHRHEPGVLDEPIEIIEDTADMLVVNKPASIPVHPCGRYMFNTLVFILAKEYGYPLENLKPLNRLDALTSGLVLLGKSTNISRKMKKALASRKIQKEYVCRVQGNFPEGIVECHAPIHVLTFKPGIYGVNPSGKESKTFFEKMFTDQDSSVIKCWPVTGRTHQIRIHLQYLGYPVINDSLYNSDIWGPNKGKGGNFNITGDELSLRVLNQLRQNMRRRPICPLPEDSTDYYTVHEGACECNKLHEGKHTRYLNDYISNSVSCGEEEYFMKCYNPGNFRKAVDSQNLSTFDDGTKNSKEYLSYIDSRNSRNELFGDTQYNPLKDSVDTYCWNCSYSSNSPELKSMFLCLHSHRYKGSNWEFESTLPTWAEPGWR